MPDAIITSTASTFGTISGTFAADQSTITGTITGIVAGTLSGSVGVPGPQGPQGIQGQQGIQGVPGSPGTPGVGVPAGGTAGQYLTKTTTGVDYATGWTTFTGATESWVTSNFYPLTGNPSGFITASALTPYLLKAGDTFTGNLQATNGSGVYLSNVGPSYLYANHTNNYSQFINGGPGGTTLTVEWDGITFAAGKQTLPYPGAATLFSSPVLTGDPTAPTPATSDNDTSIATTAFVKAQGYLTSAPVTSVAGRTGAITLSNTDISGLGTLSVINDAPSDGSQYARKNAAWDVVVSGDRYLTSSTTSNTIGNGNKTFTIGTGLSYTPTQNITISYDASNHMHGEVLTYNSGTGVMTVDVNHHTGSGTYAAWVVNVGGVTPATSVAWGAVTGVLSAQTDLQSALDLKLNASTAASTYAALSGATDLGTYTWSVPMSSNSVQVNSTSISLNGSASINIGATGSITYGDTTTQVTAYPGSSGFLLKADNLAGLANTATARTNLGLGTMAVETAADYSTTTVANGLYYPLTGNPSGFLTSAPVTSVAGRTGAITLAVADVSGAAPLDSPSFSGNPSLPTGTTAVTQAADNSTTALATTAFVVGQASSTTPAATGTAAVGTSLKYARADHVHVNPLPTGGTTGQVLSKVDGTNYNTTWTTPSGGGSGADVQTFTTPGTATWTKPAGKTMAWIRMWAGGAGGGGGYSAATTSARSGGGGGAAGGFCETWVPISLLGATETVTVGAGGAGGASATNSAGGNGGAGGNSSFNNFRAIASSLAPGAGGTTTGAGGIYSPAFVHSYNGFNPQTASYAPASGGTGAPGTGAPPNVALPNVYLFPTGGGGGGGAAANSVIIGTGGAGGHKNANATYSGLVPTIAAGTGGNPATPTNPTAGTNTLSYYIGATGGGGGGYKTATAGQNGAAGGQPGGGGGGGGAADAAFASGAGGAGGAGMVIVVCY